MLQKIPVSVQNLDIRGNPLHPDGCHAWRQIHRLTQERKILVDFDKEKYSVPAENWERLECDFEHQNNISGIISEQLTEVQTQTLHVLEKNNMVLSEIKTDVKELCKPDTHMTSLIICLLCLIIIIQFTLLIIQYCGKRDCKWHKEFCKNCEIRPLSYHNISQ